MNFFEEYSKETSVEKKVSEKTANRESGEMRERQFANLAHESIRDIAKFSLFCHGQKREKENERVSGGHFVFPARCAVLICPVNSGQAFEAVRADARGPGAQAASDGAPRRIMCTRSRVDAGVTSGDDRASRRVTSGEARLILTSVRVCYV